MTKKRVATTEECVVKQKCRHYWIIESAEGPVSKGICKFCGARKEFNNFPWDCLEEGEDGYREWVIRQGYDKEERKEGDGDILSWLGGGDKSAAKAGT